MRYEFIIRGSVSEDVMAALPELSSTPYPTGGTILFGPVQDESDVSSLLARFSDLGLSVVEMRLGSRTDLDVGDGERPAGPRHP